MSDDSLKDLPVIEAPGVNKNDHAPDSPHPSEETDEDLEARLAYESLMRHRKKRRRKKAIALSVVVGVALVACAAWAALSATSGTSEQAPQLQTMPVFRGEFSESVSATGSAQPLTSVVVTPEVDGIIEGVSVALDDHVEAGQTLFSIRNDDVDREVRQAELALRSQRIETQAQQDAYNELYYAACESGEWDAANAQLITLETARLQLEDAQEAYNAAVARAAGRTVTAPAAGSIVVMNAVEGASTTAGGLSQGADGTTSSGPLVQIADLSQMTVKVQVNEVDISRIAVGQAARMSFSALPGVMLDGEVTRISTVAAADPYGGYGGVVTYDVEVLIPEPVPELKPGMTASVEIMMQHVPDALTVPVSCLMTDDGESYYVYILTDYESQTTTRRDVTVGTQSDTTAVIESGIEEGDEVVLDPYAVAMGATGGGAAVDGGVAGGDVSVDDGMAVDSRAA